MIFGYTLLYSATVDVLMLQDGRYAASRWMEQHARLSDLIGVSGPAEVRPHLGVPTTEITSIRALEEARPAYYVLSADYARAVGADSDWGVPISGLQRDTLGYERVLQYRHPSPWPWLPDPHPDLVGDRAVRNDGDIADPFRIAETGVFSILRSVNPTIEIFKRRTATLPAP